MNERIKQLAERQTGAILMDLVMPDAGMPERIKWNIGCTAKHLEKFAELIVKECCGAADDWYQNHNDIQWDPAQHIKNHFGVEE